MALKPGSVVAEVGADRADEYWPPAEHPIRERSSR
jgi:hypothetical protein